MKEFFKKYKWLLLLFFMIPLLFSYIWFAFPGVIPSGSISKDNWLSFWGDFLAFYGTVFLGIIAIWQNFSIQDRIEKTERLRNRPYFAFTNLNLSDQHYINDLIDGKEIFKDNLICFDYNTKKWMSFVGEYPDSKNLSFNYFMIKNVGNNFAHSVGFSIKIGDIEMPNILNYAISQSEYFIFLSIFYPQNLELHRNKIKFIIRFSDVQSINYEQIINTTWNDDLLFYSNNTEPIIIE